MKTFGEFWQANVSKFHHLFENVLSPLGIGLFWLMVLGGIGVFGSSAWTGTGEEGWWMFFRVIATILAVVLGGILGALGGGLTLLAGIVTTGVLGYATCLIAALVRRMIVFHHETREARKEVAAAIKAFIQAIRTRPEAERQEQQERQERQEQQKRREQKEQRERQERQERDEWEQRREWDEWEERQEKMDPAERTWPRPTELGKIQAAIRSEASDLRSLMARLETELDSIEAPVQDRIGLAELRRIVEAELEESLRKEDWNYVKETMAAARPELSGYMHVDRSLAVLGLTRAQLDVAALKKCYFDHAKRFHPDACGAAGSEKMVQLNRAKEILERYLKSQPQPVTP